MEDKTGSIQTLIEQKSVNTLEEILERDAAHVSQEDLTNCSNLELWGIYSHYHSNSDNDQLGSMIIEERYPIDCTKVHQLAWQELIRRTNNMLPILPLHGVVVYPSVVVPVSIAEGSSIQLINAVWASPARVVGLTLSKSGAIGKPKPKDIHPIGTLAKITRVVSPPGGSLLIVVEGLQRIQIKNIVSQEPFLRGDVQVLRESPILESEYDKAMRNTKESLLRLVPKINEPFVQEMLNKLAGENNPNKFIYQATNFMITSELESYKMQEILELKTFQEKLTKINGLFSRKYGNLGYQ